MAKPSKDHTELLHDYGIHIPSKTIFLESSVADDGDEDGVNYTMSMKFLKNLHLLDAENQTINIVLNTGGGDIIQGMAIYDAIVQAKSWIIMTVQGDASSMGCVILQAADERVMMPHARLMFHLGTPDASGNNIHEVMNAATAELKYGERIDSIIYDKMFAKAEAENRVFSKGKYKDMNFKGKFMDAEEAVQLGLADKIKSK